MKTSYQQIPLTSEPNQNFLCTISVNGKKVTLLFVVRYNTMSGYWVLTLKDFNMNCLIDSMPLVTGVDLLEQYSYLKIGKAYLINISNDPINAPTDSNLGKDYVLIWDDNT